MKLIYQNKAIELIECKSFFERFRGFMLKKEIDHALLFDHCNSIHTFFMKTAIDVVLCDKEDVILYYYKDFTPNHVVLPKKAVARVYELPCHYYDIHIQDKMEVVK